MMRRGIPQRLVASVSTAPGVLALLAGCGDRGRSGAAVPPSPRSAISGFPAAPTGTDTQAAGRNVATLVAQLEQGRAVVGDVAFLGGSDTLALAGDSALAAVAQALRATRGAYLVEAHGPSSGDVTEDQWLTDRRAAAVRARLVASGIPGARLFAMGFGSTRRHHATAGVATSHIELSRMP